MEKPRVAQGAMTMSDRLLKVLGMLDSTNSTTSTGSNDDNFSSAFYFGEQKSSTAVMLPDKDTRQLYC